MQALNGIGVIAVIVLIVVAFLWIFMPFAVFGIKDLAKELIAKQRETNLLLQRLIDQQDIKR